MAHVATRDKNTANSWWLDGFALPLMTVKTTGNADGIAGVADGIVFNERFLDDGECWPAYTPGLLGYEQKIQQQPSYTKSVELVVDWVLGIDEL